MPSQKEVLALLRKYSRIVEQLYGIVHDRNVVGGYGEYIAARRLALKRQPGGNSGFDARDKNGKRYEIKSRKCNPTNTPAQFMIREVQLERTDYVVYVEFNDDWSLKRMLKIPSRRVKPNAHHMVSVTNELERKYRIR